MSFDQLERLVRERLEATLVDEAARVFTEVPSFHHQRELLRTVLDESLVKAVGTQTLLGFFKALPHPQLTLDGLQILHASIDKWVLEGGSQEAPALQIKCPKLPIVRFLQEFKSSLRGDDRSCAELYWEHWASPLVRAILHGGEVVVKYKHECLYAPANGHAYDNDRRHVFTWRSNWKPDADKEKWRIIQPDPEQDRFLIQNVYTREYLYATGFASLPDDDKGRRQSRVFLWRPGDYDEMSYWQLIPLRRGEFALYSCYREEFLHISSETWKKDDRRHVCTKNNTEDGDSWKWTLTPV